MDLKKLFNNDKAVSPVIGVVLMVAITVILAAAIGSSVFGQGPAESAPQANINIIPVDENTIKLEHLGGDTIMFDDNATTRIMFSGNTSFEIDISQFTDTSFNVGDTQVLYLHDVNDAAHDNKTQPSGQFATVKIVDVQTSQLIADKDLRF